MRQARILLVGLVVLVLAGCAGTAKGKLYQVGDVLDSLILKAAENCEKGTLNQPTCATISVGADSAVDAWKVSRTLLDEGKDASAWQKMVAVTTFILTTGANMQELGLPIPDNVVGYINLIVGSKD